jgi:hypothetical protein
MFRLFLSFSLLSGFIYADAQIAFTVGGRVYELTGAQALLKQKDGKAKILIGAKDTTTKAMIAITAEIPTSSLDSEQILTTEFTPLSLVIVNARGIYNIAPSVTLARDSFMRYTKREEVDTGELEDDPEDRHHERADECRQKHRDGPTWVGKTREERIASGDGVMREEKYRDTLLQLHLKPVKSNGRVIQFTGTFSGTVLFNEGMSNAVKVQVSGGTFDVPVQE